MAKRVPRIKIELVWRRWPGYGSPPGCSVQGVYKNKILFYKEEHGDEHSDNLAVWADRQVRKFQDAATSVSAFEAMLARKKQAFPLCANCGDPCREGSCSCLNKNWCGKAKCQAALEAAKVAYDEQVARNREDSDARMIAEQRKRNAEAQAATLGAFHWRDNWFFKRQGDGAVRVIKLCEANYTQYPKDAQHHIWLSPDLVIPANEWASIVCSVSAAGETGERWEVAQDFHGRALAQAA